MANVTPDRHNLEKDHPIWAHAFNKVTREHLVDEDLNAAKTVCGELAAIVTIGALCGILTVTFAILSGRI